MKLNKDQVQKIALGAMMLVGVVYAYFEFLLGPLQKEQEIAKASAEALEPQITAAKKQISKTKILEATGPENDMLLKQVQEMIPEGSPIAWFPPRMSEFFKRQNIEKVVSRYGNEFPDKDIPGFRRIKWTLELPSAEFVQAAAALSALENEEPLFEIQSLEVETNRETVQFQHITVNLHSISR